MIASTHERATCVFLAVVDRDGDDRARALDTLCDGDAHLRAEVESLLRHDAEASSHVGSAGGTDRDASGQSLVLDPPSLALGESLAEALRARWRTGLDGVGPERRAEGDGEAPLPESIGGYRVVSRLGRGGMSTVYRARQQSPSREVALKVLDGLGTVDPRRLALEARALARLSHPNIATIYEAGVDRALGRPRPFIAMELVEGATITAWVDDRGLSLRERIALLACVCDGVHHAHQRGVIHRDLKPANILVGADGRPRVLDFGVARLAGAAEEDSPQTLAGVLVGTLAYMSPEQLGGAGAEIDTRTDVYALGAVLFHLIAGRPPVDLSGLSLAEAAARARGALPPRLRTLVRSCPSEVELIVAKALSHDPSARYSSAADLGADLRRFLRCEPVQARPASASYTLRKLARRRPGLVGAVAVACLAVIGGTGAVAWQSRVAEAASRRAIAEGEAATAVTRFIERTFSAIDAREDGPQVRVSELLDRASSELANDPATSAEVAARLHSLFGRAYLSLGMSGRAIDELRLAVAKFPDRETSPALEARQFLANALRSSRRLDEALALAREVLGARTRVSGPGHASTVFARASLAACYSVQGDEASAEPLMREVLASQTDRLGPDHPATLHAGAMLGRTLMRMGRVDEATPLLEGAMSSARASLKPSHPTRLKIAWAIAHAHSASARPDLAEALCVEHAGAVGTYSIAHPMAQRLRENWGRSLRLQGRALEALDVLAPVAAASDASTEPNSEQAQDLRVELALTLAACGRDGEARDLAARIIRGDDGSPRLPLTPATVRAATLHAAGLLGAHEPEAR